MHCPSPLPLALPHSFAAARHQLSELLSISGWQPTAATWHGAYLRGLKALSMLSTGINSEPGAVMAVAMELCLQEANCLIVMVWGEEICWKTVIRKTAK